MPPHTPIVYKANFNRNWKRLACLRISPSATFPVNGDGFGLLGAPIATAQDVQNLLFLKFDKAAAFCGRVARLKDLQSNLALLQRCAGVCRALHLLKVVFLGIIQPFCQRLDAELLGAYEVGTTSVFPRNLADKQCSPPVTAASVRVSAS